MTNNKPYIEYNNKKYEFNANWKLKKEFNKSIQNAYANIRLSLTDEELNVFEEVKKFTEEHPTLKENDLMALPKEMKEKYIKLLNTMQSIDLSSIYEEYCFKMLNEEYQITKEEFEEILNNFSEEYGFEYVEILLQKVCEKVFTQVVEKKEKKPLPEWMN